MQLPEKLLESLEGISGFDREAFEKIHASGGQITSIRINPLKSENSEVRSEASEVKSETSSNSDSFHVSRLTSHEKDSFHDSRLTIHDSRRTSHEKIPWCEKGYYLSHRPSFTFDPLFHAGLYYVQEASSMFLEQGWRQCVNTRKPLKVLDLSAAPGGKSTHLQSLLSAGGLLVSNEVIRSRANILKDNIIKWGCENVVVTNNDPKDFAKLAGYFDVIVVDAPCSGSGLFRREPEAIEEWSENNVALCSQRQQRILADIFPALKKDGILIYSTCSYSKEEDEEIVDWLIKELRVSGLELRVNENWGIVISKTAMGGTCYRFWPDKIKGEGFFMACFKKVDGGGKVEVKVDDKIKVVSKKEKEIVDRWIDTGDRVLVKNENTVYAWPANLAEDMNFILSKLRVLYSGVRVGELMKDKLVPDHALAMSNLVAGSIPRIAVGYEQAIQYLQRKDIKIDAEKKGWQLVSYDGQPLGWVNVLPNRINNYYPKELRILKEIKSPPQ